MYQKSEFTQGVSIQHPIAAYKLHAVYFATDLIWRPTGRERVKTQAKVVLGGGGVVFGPWFIYTEDEDDKKKSSKDGWSLTRVVFH